MPERRSKPSRLRYRIVTFALFALGVGLQAAAPLLRDRVPLSDDLLITSILSPAWTFLQVCLLALVLRLLRRSGELWSVRRRAATAAGVAVLTMLPQPQFISLMMAGPAGFTWADRVSVALLWSTPLALYLVPAAIVVWAWARRGRTSLPRALGYGLMAIGVLNFGFILWLTHLWEIYVKVQQPTGP